MDAQFYESVKNELFTNILPYWEKHARDTVNTGFFGKIDNDNNKYTQVSRSIVMTARFLWTYSAIARLCKDKKYLEMADFAYDVIINKYFDKKNGGVYWSVNPDGSPDVRKKQIYGEAFCCYGLSEYAAAVKELIEEGEVSPCAQASEKSESCSTLSAGDTPATPPLSQEAMNKALDLFYLMEEHAFDKKEGGYIEACNENWKATKDMMLSSKDMNCPKSMNTNLHVMEAYTNLYRSLPVVFPDAKGIRGEIAGALSALVRVSVEKILQANAHLGMFFDMDWNLLADEISYGHDIEASWLLWEAACELENEELKDEIRDTVIRVADVALEEGFDKENGCMENFLKDKGSVRDRNRVWWNQAEAMNGFYNAWEMTKDNKFKEACILQWKWIMDYQVDKVGGEWWAELDENGNPILKEAKGGNWKTSYHNGRTCMELLRRAGKF